MAERPKHWVKLWVSWLTSPAHLELSGGALGLGPLLLLLATWDGEYESGGWLIGEDGTPYNREALARATHRTRAELDRQLLELVRVGTLVIDGRGAYGFAHFGKFQESHDAKRGRQSKTGRRPADGKTSFVYFAVVENRCRIGFSRNPWARVKDMTNEIGSTATLVRKDAAAFSDLADVHARFADHRISGEWFHYSSDLRDYVRSSTVVTTDVAATVVTTSETTDDRRQINSLRSSTPTPPREGSSSGISTETQAEALALSNPPPKPRATAKPRKPRADLPAGLADHVLTELVRACRELDGPTAGPRHDAEHEPYLDALRKLHAAHAPTADEWTAVIRERLALSREGQTFGSLTVASLCAPANFERWLAAARARSRGSRGSSTPTRPGPAAPSPRPTESRTVIVRRGSDDDGQAGAA